jgi:hypothetical protein
VQHVSQLAAPLKSAKKKKIKLINCSSNLGARLISELAADWLKTTTMGDLTMLVSCYKTSRAGNLTTGATTICTGSICSVRLKNKTRNKNNTKQLKLKTKPKNET